MALAEEAIDECGHRGEDRAVLLVDDDRLLVTLAGEDHGVLGRGAANGLAHRLAAIVDDDVVGAFALARADRALLDLLEDFCRLLEAWVLLRDHEEVRVFRSDLREHRPLRAVALAGAAEDRDELSFRERAEEAEDLVERLRRMRVVDDHAEGLPAFDTLHAPAHGARPRERLARVLQRRARRETGGGRGQRAVDIEASDEG